MRNLHMAIVRKNGSIVIDSNFSYDVHDDENWDTRYATGKQLNPVRILNDYWQMFENTLRATVREIWLGDWVLDCKTGEIVLHNDWVVRHPNYKDVAVSMKKMIGRNK
jgi:hypothetical protein